MNQLFSWLKRLGYVVSVAGIFYEVYLLKTNKLHLVGGDPILLMISTGMGLLVTGALGNFLFSRIFKKTVHKDGIESTGEILFVRKTGFLVEQEPEIELTLSYYANGEQIIGVIRQVISSEDITWMVEGAEIEIKYLREDPRRVALKKGPP